MGFEIASNTSTAAGQNQGPLRAEKGLTSIGFSLIVICFKAVM
jgi:hypothetical protein